MRLQLSVRRLKALLWAVSSLAFVPAGWTFLDIVDGKHEGRYTARPHAYFQDVLWEGANRETWTPRPPNYDPASRRTMWELAINGSWVEPVVAGPQTDPTPRGLPAPAAVVDVGLIVWSDDPFRRFVAIEYSPTDGRPRVDRVRRLHLSEGESLASPYGEAPYHGRVLTIERQTVTIQWGDEQFTLHPGMAGSRSTAVPADAFVVPMRDDTSPPSAPTASVRLDDETWVLGADDRRELETLSLDELVEQLVVTTVRPGGGARSRLELTEVAPDSLPARFGFVSGDRILSINGIPMPDLSSAVHWLLSNPGVVRYDVVYERKGKQLSLTIHAPD